MEFSTKARIEIRCTVPQKFVDFVPHANRSVVAGRGEYSQLVAAGQTRDGVGVVAAGCVIETV